MPDEWPPGRFDLVSISEVGYLLSSRELDEVIVLARDALRDDGHLVLCHWRHEIVGWPLDGADVHERFLSTGAQVLVEQHERDFELYVLAHWS